MAEPAIPSRFPTTLGDEGMYILRSYCDPFVDIVIRLNDRLDYERLTRAMRLLFDAEPVLGCRFTRGWWRSWWVRRTDLDTVAPWKLVETDDVDAEVTAALSARVDPVEDPLVHLSVVRGEVDTLVLKVNHLVADAGGVKDTAYRLAELYRRLETEPDHRPEPNLGERGLGQVFRHLGLLGVIGAIFRGLRNAWGSLRRHMRWSFPSHDAPTGRGVEPPAETFRQLTASIAGPTEAGHSRFAALKAWGRERGATLNDLVMTAYFRALRKICTRTARLRAMTTADLRLHHIPSRRAEAIANLSGFAYLDIGMHLGDTFEDTLAKVSRATKKLKQGYLGLGDIANVAPLAKVYPFAIGAWLFYWGFRIVPYVTPHPPLTNMGPIDPERLDFGAVQVDWAYTTVPIMFPPIVGMGLSGFKNTLTLSSGYCSTAVEEGVVEDFLGLVVGDLEAVVEGKTLEPTA